MADVNWTKYGCSLCLMLGLITSAVVSGLVGWLMIGAGLPVVLSVLLFFAVWAALGFLVDRYCHGRAAAAASGAAAGHRATTRAADETAEAERQPPAAEEAAAAERTAGESASREAETPADAASGAVRTMEPATAAQAADDPKAAQTADGDGDGVVERSEEGTRPEALDGPRGGEPDDLKKIKGIGPKLEKLCNQLGFYHFDQIAGWTADEIAWVDSNLEGFRGRVSRDEWVAQARVLAEGGET